ncbi:dicarboxylate/amino acid:cation symporter [bacterium]|nr:dicarboxylate/amino acid:cation symporter [bacterium]
MILGIITGLVMGEKAAMFHILGVIFIRLIKMLVVPLIFFSILLGAHAMGLLNRAGKVAAKTFGFYIMTTVIAVCFGIAATIAFAPGKGLDYKEIQAKLGGGTTTDYSKEKLPTAKMLIEQIIPHNPFESLTQGNILQILFFTLFLGFGLGKVKDEFSDPVIAFCRGFNEVLIWMIHKVMFVAPFGVFGLMAEVTGTFGFDILLMVGKLLALYVVVLLFHTFCFYGFIIKFFTRYGWFEFFGKARKVQMVALSTASSMATLPIALDVSEKDLGIDKGTCSFVLPLGATINMDGNSIYYGMAAIFFAQMFGIPVGTSVIVSILITATVGSIGQAGVPGPSFLIVPVLKAASIPLTGLPLFIAVDRIFDMLRTAVNVTGDMTCAAFIQGKDKLK